MPKNIDKCFTDFFRCQGQEHRWARSQFRPFMDLNILSAMVLKGIIALSKFEYFYIPTLFSNNSPVHVADKAILSQLSTTKIVRKVYRNFG